MPGPYAPTAPTVSGTQFTVDAYLNNVPLVTRDLEDLTLTRFIADFLLREGERTEAGAVAYQELLTNDLYLDRDVQEIQELSEFPILNAPERDIQMAHVKKWGGAVLFSDEARRRNKRDLLGRDLRRLSNTVVRKVNRITFYKINTAANVRVHAAPAPWSDATNRRIIEDLVTAKTLIEESEMGYEPDTLLVNPTQGGEMLTDRNVREALPRESGTDNPILAGDLTGILDLEVVKTTDVAEGTAYVASRQMVGSFHDELPFYSRVVPMPWREGTLLMAARVTVPVITDPLAVVRLTGL